MWEEVWILVKKQKNDEINIITYNIGETSEECESVK